MPKKHTVQQGECLSSIAHLHGFQLWKTIYDHPDNADFKKKRPNPSLICPGDEIVIPDKRQNSANVPVKHTQTATFKVKKAVTLLRIIVKDAQETALAGKKYALAVGGVRLEGKTTSEGLVEQNVAHTAQEGELTVWLTDDLQGPLLHWDLKIGHLDPVDTVAGVQARLNNLGFPSGEVDGALGPRTQRAIRTFQRDVGLDMTGEIDDATKQKLAEAHGKI